MDRSVGLMMARQAGVDRSTADYFAIMDSHMEVAEGMESNKSNVVQRVYHLHTPLNGSIGKQ